MQRSARQLFFPVFLSRCLFSFSFILLISLLSACDPITKDSSQVNANDDLNIERKADRDNRREQDRDDEEDDEDDEEDRSDNNRDGDSESDNDSDRDNNNDGDGDGDNPPATSNASPNARIVLPAQTVRLIAGESVRFSGAGTDPDGDYPLTYHWDFDGVAQDASTQSPASVRFNNVGTFRVQLTVTDSRGASDLTPATRLIIVSENDETPTVNLAPNGIITSPAGSSITIEEGQSVFFNGAGNDPENNLPLSFLWNFDGAAANAASQNPGSVEFTNPGVYNVRLTVTDSLGLSDVTPAIVLVNVIEINNPPVNLAPIGNITSPEVSSLTINAGQSVVFSGMGSDPDNNLPLSYFWNFDGVRSNAVIQNPGTVMFNNPGNYNISLTVTDSLGASDLTPATVFVNVVEDNNPTVNLAPNGSIISPAVGSMTIQIGQTVFFNASGNDPDNNTPLTYRWNFDGAVPNQLVQTPGNITFGTIGTYLVQLIVTDSLGLEDPSPAILEISVINSDGGNPPPVLNTSHAGRYSLYEGSKTCIGCHETEVHEAHSSVHYQLQGPAPHVTNISHGGKLGGINDFCGYPDINFIGILTNLDGVQVDGGCATCHAGMGAKPEPVATTAQLENIDCLVCHSDSYKRKVEQQTDGSFRFTPAAEKMSVSILEAITDIQKTPSRGTCVNCHSYAGGGCNNKRGDLEEAHREPPGAWFDVHMASTQLSGAGLVCTDCHTTQNHRIAGRGVDLQPTDLDVPVVCTNCHNSRPHGNNDIDNHTAKVDCAACHIPHFAKIVSTDMLRDFSQPALIDETKRLYEPHITRESNVTPVYRFFNGSSRIYEFGTAAVTGNNGKVTMAEPLGSRSDASAKIYPFKRHEAIQPIDPATQRLLPLKMGVLFQTGNVDAAIQQGVAEVGWSLPNGYDFANTERYMGIYHEVSPKEEALTCNACHENNSRMDFAALGYTPKTTRNGSALCNSCHGSESGGFFDIHQRHVDRENIDCSECHNF